MITQAIKNGMINNPLGTCRSANFTNNNREIICVVGVTTSGAGEHMSVINLLSFGSLLLFLIC